MAGANVVELTDKNFEQEVLNSEIPVLVDFWAEWCGPCKMVAPVIDAVASELKGRVKVGKLNIDDNFATAQRYSVMSIPTLLVIQDGEVRAQKVGAVGKDELLQVIEDATGVA